MSNIFPGLFLVYLLYLNAIAWWHVWHCEDASVGGAVALAVLSFGVLLAAVWP